MDQQRYRAARLENIGKDAERSLLLAITQTPIGSGCYAYKTRVKSEERLIEKVRRKRYKKHDYCVDSITDVVGLRLVTIFRRETPIMVNEIMAMINHESVVQPNPFVRGCLSEVIIYSTNPPADEIAQEIFKNLSEREINAELQLSREGYSSIHIVSRLIARAKHGSHATDDAVPIEIQIRTVFEDAWGEIDHKFGYTLRQGKESGSPIRNPQRVQAHLKILKKFSDACAEYADAIYSEAVQEDTPAIANGKVISVGSDEEIITKFQGLGISEDLVAQYVAARETRQGALKAFQENQEDGKRSLLEAAELFHGLADSALRKQLGEQAIFLFCYYVRMNEALCLLALNNKEFTLTALGIYNALEEKYKDFPLLKFRIAQSLGKLGHVDQSIDRYQSAWAACEAVVAQIRDDQWPAELPVADYEHIRNTLPKLLGYQYWMKSEQLNADSPNYVEQKAKLLRQAFDTTRILLEFASGGELISIHNNLLYYAIALVTCDNQEGVQPAEDIKKQIEASLRFMEDHADPSSMEDLEQIDTLMRAYDYLGQPDMVTSLAKRAIELGFNATTADPEHNQGIIEMTKYAWSMVKKHGALRVEAP